MITLLKLFVNKKAFILKIIFNQLLFRGEIDEKIKKNCLINHDNAVFVEI